MELRFSPLFSGSSGNAIYVGCDDAHILVDAGMSGTRVIQEMLGHSSIATTEVYTHVDQDRLSELHRQFHPRR